MPKLIYYRQKRFDGGIRTGIELVLDRDFVGIDNFSLEQTLLEEYEQGDGERDPSLIWYVDIQCEGSGIPEDPAQARDWFLRESQTICEGLATFADHLRRVGADIDDYPMQWSDFPDLDQVQVRLSCSMIRRIDARHFAEILDDIRGHWSERIGKMIAHNQTLSVET